MTLLVKVHGISPMDCRNFQTITIFIVTLLSLRNKFSCFEWCFVERVLIHFQTTIQDLIQIKPQDFEKPSAQAIKDVINDKYSNRIIPNIGLCLCMWDLLSASEGLIGHGTGLVNVNGALSRY